MKKKRRILVVDDYAAIRRSIAALLERHEIPFLALENGHAALEEMQREPAPLVITDHRMPGMTGLELITAIRRRWKLTRCILITGYESAAVVQEAVALGVRIVLKPFDAYDFVMAVHGELAAYEWARKATNGNGHHA